jgi:hypothetical protein
MNSSWLMLVLVSGLALSIQAQTNFEPAIYQHDLPAAGTSQSPSFASRCAAPGFGQSAISGRHDEIKSKTSTRSDHSPLR